MNRETLFDAMNGIKDEYIVEADPTVTASVPMMRRLRPILSMAAVMVLVIGIVSVAGNLFGAKNEAAVPMAREATADFKAVEETGTGTEAYAVVTEEGAAEEAAAAEAAPTAEPAEVEETEEAFMENVTEDCEEAVSEVTKQEVPERERAIEIGEIFRDGVCYVYDSVLPELPAGMSEDGTLSSEAEALYYTPYGHNGEPVYFDLEHPDRLIVSLNGEWVCYKQ